MKICLLFYYFHHKCEVFFLLVFELLELGLRFLVYQIFIITEYNCNLILQYIYAIITIVYMGLTFFVIIIVDQMKQTYKKV